MLQTKRHARLQITIKMQRFMAKMFFNLRGGGTDPSPDPSPMGTPLPIPNPFGAFGASLRTPAFGPP